MTSFDNFAMVSDHLYFGRYPDRDDLDLLKKLGVTLIVDLTNKSEMMRPYHWDMERIHVPCVDQSILPDEHAIHLVETIAAKQKITYIHCKGGHGRSAVIACLLYKFLTQCSAEEALTTIHHAHQTRKNLKPKFRRLGAPQTKIQREQVKRLQHYSML
jgi:hypothetical protein